MPAKECYGLECARGSRDSLSLADSLHLTLYTKLYLLLATCLLNYACAKTRSKVMSPAAEPVNAFHSSALERTQLRFNVNTKGDKIIEPTAPRLETLLTV